jgi:hypothetical protein
MISNISFGMTVLGIKSNLVPDSSVSKMLSPQQEMDFLADLNTELKADAFKKNENGFELKTNPDYKVRVFKNAIEIQQGQEKLTITNTGSTKDKPSAKFYDHPIAITPEANKRIITRIIDNFKTIKEK